MLEGQTTDTGLVGNCLSSDGTTKLHHKYQSFQVTTTSGKKLSIGMKDLAGGDAAEAISRFQHTVDDIAEAIVSDKDVAYLITSLKSTMSDKCSVNHVFNAKLQSLRTNLLPAVIDCWDTLTETEKSAAEDLGNFFCRMHILVNMALDCDKTLQQLETLTAPNRVAIYALPVW